jgi:uncharacterized protein (TIGR02391 family)
MDKVPRSLLEELARASLPNLEGTHAAKFRAQHRKYFGEINRLEWDRYIEKTGDNHRPTLLGLSEVLNSVAELEPFSRRFEGLFKILKQHYEEHYGGRITLNELSAAAGLTREETNFTLSYMVQASIFGTHTADFQASEDAFVAPSEDILRYQSFSQVLEEMRSRRIAHLQEDSTTATPDERTDDNVENFEFLLHPLIIKHALPQYNNGHFRNAVLDSIVAVFDLIRERTGLKGDGAALVEAAFSLQQPYLILSELDTPSGTEDQKGFIQILKGAYQGIRNPKAHSLSHDLTGLKAAQYLVFASLLARRVDEAKSSRREAA